ncbi:cupredoxin domain-containing protein [Methanolobus profundi]|uniref:Plastocyanin n=1 Tax=Methanolobus profundi TaxID=487685 RepID=A0A1I4PX78_9EURY|nr:hypothetical protein [Methanolobus profundi]SFM32421.1 hypothetical protein SAMN04488696_0964 [Methanolobus profundi]
MKAKILIILLILLSFTVIGCVDDEEETTVVNDTDNVTTEDVVEETTNDTDMNATVEEEMDDPSEKDEPKIIDYEGAKTYTIYMENFLAQPSDLTINEGDSVMWFNRNDPKRIFTLISNEDLWENTSMGYRLSFTYTFNESGTYTYKVLGWEERMKGTITVK